VKVGDLVIAVSTVDYYEAAPGIIISFNKKGEGGKDFVHVLAADGTIMMFNFFDIEVISESR